MQTLVKEIAEKVKGTDELTISAILEILAEHGCELPEHLKESRKFEGENPTLSEYEKLSIQQQCELQDAAAKWNDSWIRQKFAELNATWLFVIDGDVIAYGSDLSSYPEDDFIDSICQQTGKFPFVFIDERELMIEESTVWHTTNRENDWYPTLELTISEKSASVDIIGDFDTGAIMIFADIEFLQTAQVVKLRRAQVVRSAFHFNRRYMYIPMRFTIALQDASGIIRESRQTINCVLNWQQSPFIQVNPNRTALIGREVLLEIKPKVLLDFLRNVTVAYF
jgi:hypothetical protein